MTTDGLTPDDDACLRMLAGAHFGFGPQSGITLPSGRRLTASEAQALTSFYAPPAGPLSSEHDAWTGDPETDRALLVARAHADLDESVSARRMVAPYSSETEEGS